MSKKKKKNTQSMFLEVPKRTHLGFKLACLMEGRSMKEVLLDTMQNFADLAESWDVADEMLAIAAKKRVLEEIESPVEVD